MYFVEGLKQTHIILRIEIDPFTLSHCIHEGISYLIANSNNIAITFGIWHGRDVILARL